MTETQLWRLIGAICGLLGLGFLVIPVTWLDWSYNATFVAVMTGVAFGLVALIAFEASSRT